MHVDKLAAKPVKDMSVVGANKNRTNSPKKSGVRFDPPLNLHSYILVAPFLSRLVVSKEAAQEEERKPIHHSGEKSPTVRGKKVWVEVPTKGKKQEKKVR